MAVVTVTIPRKTGPDGMPQLGRLARVERKRHEKSAGYHEWQVRRHERRADHHRSSVQRMDEALREKQVAFIEETIDHAETDVVVKSELEKLRDQLEGKPQSSARTSSRSARKSRTGDGGQKTAAAA